MSRPRSSPGFTLIELIVATFLSSIVLMGMFSLMSSMISAEVRDMRSGTVTAWALAGINAMNADIASSSAVTYPPPGSAGDNSLIICTNWSVFAGANGKNLNFSLDHSMTTSVYNYCWDNTDAAPSPYANALLRNVAVDQASCTSVPIPCDASHYGADSVVATGVYQDAAGDPVFSVLQNASNTSLIRLVHVRLAVGNPAAGVTTGGNDQTVLPMPVSVPFDTEITLED